MAAILDEAGNNLLDELSAIIYDELGIDVVSTGASGIRRLGLGYWL